MLRYMYTYTNSYDDYLFKPNVYFILILFKPLLWCSGRAFAPRGSISGLHRPKSVLTAPLPNAQQQV